MDGILENYITCFPVCSTWVELGSLNSIPDWYRLLEIYQWESSHDEAAWRQHSLAHLGRSTTCQWTIQAYRHRLSLCPWSEGTKSNRRWVCYHQTYDRWRVDEAATERDIRASPALDGFGGEWERLVGGRENGVYSLIWACPSDARMSGSVETYA